MKRLITIFVISIFIFTSISCQAIPALDTPLDLATSTENYVKVSITLENKANGQFLLSATFTPLAPDLHLYSKDIPKTGMNGLGRPTLLELAKDSTIQVKGELIESTPSQIPLFEPKELLVYPAGSITLSIPILLPDGNKWINEQVLVTYMACNEQGCRPPIEEKIIAIQIPGSGLFKP